MKARLFALAVASSALTAGAAYPRPQMMAYRSFLPELEETARFADMGIPLRTTFIANTISAKWNTDLKPRQPVSTTGARCGLDDIH